MSDLKKLLFIVNKHAGTGYQSHVEGKIIDACVRNNTECTIQFTSGRGHATDLAKQGVGKYDAIVAVGGDGTVNETVRGLVPHTTPLGILPTGSGNGLARHLGIPLSLEPALKSLLSGERTLIDSFKINGRLSVNVSGIGFDGHIANLFGQHRQRGFWGYAGLVLKQYLSYKEFRWVLHQPKGTTHYKSFIVVIANSSQYGNNAYIAPLASVSDSKLDLCTVKKPSPFKGCLFILRMFRRKLHTNDTFHSMTVTDCELHTAEPVAYHVDGEPGGIASIFTIEIFPASIHMIVPRNNVG